MRASSPSIAVITWTQIAKKWVCPTHRSRGVAGGLDSELNG